MNKMVMLCGLPGSGKSTYAKKLKEEEVIIHSSDKIREELGDVNDQSKNTEVFEILHKRIKNDLQNGKSVCYDATNLSRKRRRAFLQELKNISCEKICVLVATPFEECCKQNESRDRKVPQEVLDKMYRGFNVPCEQEGWDEIVVYYPNEEWKEYYGDVAEYVNGLCDFDQENHHHELPLGIHMLKTLWNAMPIPYSDNNKNDNVEFAALSHDIGKVETKTFENTKGEITEEAHYYSHENVGSYKSLFFTYPDYVNKKYVALLIELHMKPYMAWRQSEKAKEKDRVLFGDKVFDDIMLLHEADLWAH